MNVETGRLGHDNCENMLRTLINLARLNVLGRAECCGTTSEERDFDTVSSECERKSG